MSVIPTRKAVEGGGLDFLGHKAAHHWLGCPTALARFPG
jgi:hypothetical protein